MEKINICFTFDNNYSKHCATTMASILANRKENYFINFYLVNNGISEENQAKFLNFNRKFKDFEINFVTIDEKKLAFADTVVTNCYLNLTTYFRLLLTDLLPKDVEKVLYLDCDLVVLNDINELYKNDINDFCAGGVIDRLEHQIKIHLDFLTDEDRYFNAGVFLFNLKKMREMNFSSLVLECAIKNQEMILCGDQDIINLVLKDQIKILDDKFNYPSRRMRRCLKKRFFRTRKTIVVNHSLGMVKAWHGRSPLIEQMDYNKYLKLTGWGYLAKNFFTILVFSTKEHLKKKLKAK